jgi:hypothetical protein
MEDVKVRLTQAPVIEFSTIEAEGVKVRNLIDSLDVENQVATADTVSSLKKIKAELNSSAKEYEDVRKLIKSKILEPYTEFETAYKEHIITPYKAAESLLKTKIASVEDEVKSKKDKDVLAYFKELCEDQKIDFLPYSKVRPNITLSASLKKLRETVLQSVNQVSSDLEVITTQEHQIELLAEYKRTLNLTESIRSVTLRKDMEKREKERAEQNLITGRIKGLQSLAMIYHSASQTYHWVQDESLVITRRELETLSASDWDNKFRGVAEEIEKRKPQPVQAPEKEDKTSEKENKAPVLQTPVAQAPEKEEQVYTSTFTVTATLDQLKALKQYLISNNITIK